MPFALISLALAIGASGAQSSQSAQRHVINLVVPTPREPQEPRDLPAQLTIAVEVPGKPALRITDSQRMAIDLVDGQAVLSFEYPSGLRLKTIVRSEDTDLLLPEPQIAPVVVKDSYGLGVPGAKIEARGGGGRFSWTSAATTSLMGRATLARPATAAGRLFLSVRADGFSPRVDEIDLRADQDTIVTLEAAGTIRGTVVDQTNASHVVMLRLWRIAQSRDRVLQRPVKKDFTLDALSAGDYELDFVMPRLGVMTVGGLKLTPGQYLDLGPLDLTPSAALEGDVTNLEHTPVGGVRVRLSQRLSQSSAPVDEIPEARTDANGHYIFSRLLAGEYHPELFLEGVGWRTFPDESVIVYPRQSLKRSFEFAASGCSLSVDFVPEAGATPATYSIQLPVTDRPVIVHVAADPVERTFASVPCEGAAAIRRTDGDNHPRFVTLAPGDTRLTIPVTAPRSATLFKLRIGGRPVAGASVWVTPRTSTESIVKSRALNVTDESGQAMLLMPSTDDDVTLYLQIVNTLLIVDRAQMPVSDGNTTLDLPNRSLAGTVSDEDGRPVASVAFSGNVMPEDGGAGSNELPASTVTLFKGVTGQDGRFEVSGLAQGKWTIHFNRTAGQRHVSHDAELDLRSAAEGATALHIRLPLRDRP